jgi:hypothetical protein
LDITSIQIVLTQQQMLLLLGVFGENLTEGKGPQSTPSVAASNAIQGAQAQPALALPQNMDPSWVRLKFVLVLPQISLELCTQDPNDTSKANPFVHFSINKLDLELSQFYTNALRVRKPVFFFFLHLPQTESIKTDLDLDLLQMNFSLNSVVAKDCRQNNPSVHRDIVRPLKDNPNAKQLKFSFTSEEGGDSAANLEFDQPRIIIVPETAITLWKYIEPILDTLQKALDKHSTLAPPPVPKDPDEIPNSRFIFNATITHPDLCLVEVKEQKDSRGVIARTEVKFQMISKVIDKVSHMAMTVDLSKIEIFKCTIGKEVQILIGQFIFVN